MKATDGAAKLARPRGKLTGITQIRPARTTKGKNGPTKGQALPDSVPEGNRQVLTEPERRQIFLAIERGAYVQVRGGLLDQQPEGTVIALQDLAPVHQAASSVARICQAMFKIKLKSVVLIREGKALVPIIETGANPTEELIPEKGKIAEILRTFRELVEAGAEAIAQGKPAQVPQKLKNSGAPIFDEENAEKFSALMESTVVGLAKLNKGQHTIALPSGGKGGAVDLKLPAPMETLGAVRDSKKRSARTPENVAATVVGFDKAQNAYYLSNGLAIVDAPQGQVKGLQIGAEIKARGLKNPRRIVYRVFSASELTILPSSPQQTTMALKRPKK